MEREFGISHFMKINVVDVDGTIRNTIKPRQHIDIYYQGTLKMIGFTDDRPKVLQTGFLTITVSVAFAPLVQEIVKSIVEPFTVSV